MAYRLADQVTCCIADGTPIFLDARRRRYFGLGAQAASAFFDLLESGGRKPSADASLLVEMGLVEPTNDPRIETVNWTAPTTSILETEETTGKAALAAIVQVGLSLVRSRSMLRRPIAEIFAALGERARPSGGAAPDVELIEASVRFHRARRRVPISPICLQDSLAMLDFLRKRGLDADLVIGVRTYPFHAHCWLQAGSVVLNETLHDAAGHTPIRVL